MIIFLFFYIYIYFQDPRRRQIRLQVREGTEKQAKDMLRRSAGTKTPTVEIDDCVIIPIPTVDRPTKMTMTNLLGVIVNIREDDGGNRLYDVATKHGKLRPLLSRTQFEVCRRRDLLDPIVSTGTTSLRDAVAAIAPPITTNLICHCILDFCRTRRCICKRSGVMCTARCKHPMTKCSNNNNNTENDIY